MTAKLCYIGLHDELRKARALAAPCRDAHTAAQVELEACETRLKTCEELARKKRDTQKANESLVCEDEWSTYRTPAQVGFGFKRLKYLIYMCRFGQSFFRSLPTPLNSAN